MPVPDLEKKLGIEIYATRSPGINGCIRRFFEDFVVEELLVDGSKATISPVARTDQSDGGRYLLCVMVKRNWDTIIATRVIAKRLGVSPKRIQIAGLKDTKALTAQHLTIKNVTPTRIANVKIKDISLYPIKYVKSRMFSQLLFGNQFQVIIRAIPYSPTTIVRRVQKVQHELVSLGGVPNFFGHQRFGTVRPITHLVGSLLVRGELEKAALTFLAQPSEHEHPESKEARTRLQNTNDFERALAYFPRYLRYERWMLAHLAKYPRDFVGAFRELPLKLRKLFLHAYQSFLFNRFLSERIKQKISLTAAQSGDSVIKRGCGVPTNEFAEGATLTPRSGKKSLNESQTCVALPLIGFKQPPSEGAQGEIEREILETEKITPQNFQVSFMPEISAPGALRAILIPIHRFSVEAPSNDSHNPSEQKTLLGFALPRGSYATVLLREFMKPPDLITAGY